jgi:hypothetical protein
MQRSWGTIIACFQYISSRGLPFVYIDNCSKEDHRAMNLEPSRQTKKTRSRAPVSTPAKAAAPTTPRTRQPVSPCDDLHILIAKRAYELYNERGYRHGFALDDWLDAEREIVSQIPPV